MCYRRPTAMSVIVMLMPMWAVAQSGLPRTAWGNPDLQGVWDYRTLTPLERPEELGDKAFLTEEEAATIERETLERNQRLLNRPPERTRASDQVDRREDGTPGFYNNFWLDRGTAPVETRRTSLIVEPSNGRLAPLTPKALWLAESAEVERIAGVRRGELPAASWTDLDLGASVDRTVPSRLGVICCERRITGYSDAGPSSNGTR